MISEESFAERSLVDKLFTHLFIHFFLTQRKIVTKAINTYASLTDFEIVSWIKEFETIRIPSPAYNVSLHIPTDPQIDLIWMRFIFPKFPFNCCHIKKKNQRQNKLWVKKYKLKFGHRHVTIVIHLPESLFLIRNNCEKDESNFDFTEFQIVFINNIRRTRKE